MQLEQTSKGQQSYSYLAPSCKGHTVTNHSLLWKHSPFLTILWLLVLKEVLRLVNILRKNGKKKKKITNLVTFPKPCRVNFG